ncbi:MAG: toll/interleukin-1 receptor domain-containing protein [Planctomycetes bacterium]|nr:toll/interleukin-1 receptor domain-containing protein [Planctomycetota bacterium]
MRKVFLSHSRLDAELALRVKNLLDVAFGRTVEVFLAIHHGAVPVASDWQSTLHERMADSDVFLLIASSAAMASDWVVGECGIASYLATPKSGGSAEDVRLMKIVVARVAGFGPDHVPRTLRKWQSSQISVVDEVRCMVGYLADYLEVNRIEAIDRLSQASRDVVGEVVEAASSAVYDWSGVTGRLPYSAKAKECPLRADNAVKLARERVLVFGQSLQFLARHEKTHQAICEFLCRNPTARFGIAMGDKMFGPGVKVWQAAGPSTADTFSYAKQLKFAESAFRRLRKSMGPFERIRFEVKFYDIIPFGAIVIDPDAENAALVIHPMLVGSDFASERPQFFVEKRSDPALFACYWAQLSHQWNYRSKRGLAGA